VPPVSAGVLRGIAFGVPFEARVDDRRLLPAVRARLPPGSAPTRIAPAIVLSLVHEVSDTMRWRTVSSRRRGRGVGLTVRLDGQPVARGLGHEDALDVFESELQLSVARRAQPEVFVHAGVVAVGGRAIVVPGRSGTGKTTLVRALVDAGATYFSDEYAVIDGAPVCKTAQRAGSPWREGTAAGAQESWPASRSRRAHRPDALPPPGTLAAHRPLRRRVRPGAPVEHRSGARPSGGGAGHAGAGERRSAGLPRRPGAGGSDRARADRSPARDRDRCGRTRPHCRGAREASCIAGRFADRRDRCGRSGPPAPSRFCAEGALSLKLSSASGGRSAPVPPGPARGPRRRRPRRR